MWSHERLVNLSAQQGETEGSQVQSHPGLDLKKVQLRLTHKILKSMLQNIYIQYIYTQYPMYRTDN